LHFLDEGYEVTGQVLEVGSKVTRLKPGDAVIGLLSDYGGYAEEAVAPQSVSVFSSLWRTWST